MKHCTECGSTLPQPNPKHCPKCGATTTAKAEEPTAKAAISSPSQVQQPPKIPEVPLPALIILLLLLLVVGFYKYGSPFDNPTPSVVPTLTPTASPTPFRGILDGAFFYKGPRPLPKTISYFDDQERNRTILALPGEVLVRAPANATRADVEKKLAAIGVSYKLLAAIPKIGSYLVEVTPGQEAYFISTLHTLSKLGTLEENYLAAPNFMISVDADPVDLSDQKIIGFDDEGIPICGERLYNASAFLGTPDTSAKVITALIDTFKREKPGVPSHGENAEAALRANCGGCPVLKLDVGAGSVGFDVIERAFAAAIAGGEINCQDVVVSLSFNPARYYNLANADEAYRFNDKILRDYESSADYEDFMRMMLAVMANSKWALAGHVRLHNSAGNGALLCAAPAPGETLCSDKKKIRGNQGIDLSQAMNYLPAHPAYGKLMRNVRVWCAYEHGTVQLASYSNYGPGIGCKEPYGNLLGTSFSAPIGAGEDYLAIKKRIAGEGQDCTPVLWSSQPMCPPNGVVPTPIIVTAKPTAFPDTECSSDAQCQAKMLAMCEASGGPTKEDDCRKTSEYWRCGFDKICHICLYKRETSIEGVKGNYLGCMTCAEGINAGLEGDGCPQQFYCERDVCVLQSGTTILTTS